MALVTVSLVLLLLAGCASDGYRPHDFQRSVRVEHGPALRVECSQPEHGRACFEVKGTIANTAPRPLWYVRLRVTVYGIHQQVLHRQEVNVVQGGRLEPGESRAWRVRADGAPDAMGARAVVRVVGVEGGA